MQGFFTSSDQSRYTLWSCQNVCDALSYLLGNIDIWDQVIQTNCWNIAALSRLFYFYIATKEISWILLTMTIKLMSSRLFIRLSGTSITLNIDNHYFQGMVN